MAYLKRRLALLARRKGQNALGHLAVGLLKVIRHTDPDRMADFLGRFMRYWGPYLPEHRVGRQNLVAAFPEKSPEEIEAKKKLLEETIAKATENRKTFEGPYWIWNPKLNITKRPRLWIGTQEWEGPIVEWPPKGRKALFFDDAG